MFDPKVISNKLLLYIEKNASANQIKIARKLFYDDAVFYDLDNFNNNVYEFDVSTGYGFYDDEYVTIITNKNFDITKTSCSCSTSKGKSLCSHICASIYELIDLVELEIITEEADPSVDKFYLNNLSESNILSKVSEDKVLETKNLLKQKNGITLSEINNGILNATVNQNKNKFEVKFINIKNTNYLTPECSCSAGLKICEHKAAAIIKASKQYSEFDFYQSHNWDTEISNAISQINLTLDDDYKSYVNIDFIEGNISLSIKDNINILNVSKFQNFKLPDSDTSVLTDPTKSNVVGYAFVMEQYTRTQNVELIPFYGKYNKSMELKVGITKITDYNMHSVLDFFDSNDYMLINLSKELEKVNSIADSANTSLQSDVFIKRQKILESCFELLKDKNVFIVPEYNISTQFTGKQLQSVTISEDRISTVLDFKIKDKFISINSKLYLNDKIFELKKQIFHNYPFIFDNNILYLWKSYHHRIPYVLFDISIHEETFIPRNMFSDIQHILESLQGNITINFNNMIKESKEVAEPIRKVIFSETGNFLMITPVVQYEDVDVKIDKNTSAKNLNIISDKGIVTISRNNELENKFRDFIVGLHPSFSSNSNQNFFFVKADEVMKKMWFIRFCQACKDEKIELFGFNNLKKIKYYPGTAKISYGYSSDIDWFNTEVNVQFGEHTVSLKDVQKAVLKNDGMVKLSDDSLGVLPEEWIKKWKTALELGKVKDNELKLTKSQFAIINSLYSDINNEDLFNDLSDKLKLLDSFDKLESIKPSSKLKAKLRNYQQEGLNWLSFLVDYGFGGCLADDMGLGKTLQLLALISHLKFTKKIKKTHLVVCPTTLLFNWQKEVEKFCPDLITYTHWGVNRDSDISNWKKYDVVFSSYGTITNDIESISKFRIGALILDESQAIKNPGSLRFKAVCLLKADYRFTMTGTPVENNTVELFSQMQFLNPGMLGTLNHFKNEFAAPIDKGIAPEKAEELRKLIYPFLLRRTKEVVATELPEKTEMVLYCEMGKEQRAVYDAFVSEYKSKILNEIEEEGIGKTQFTILDALLKARQICNSPALLNTEENYGDASVKTDELLRHIEDKTGKHKILVFSQFVGMLSIIRKRLDADGIKYSYLDGSTRNREEVVDNFVNKDDIRVFLISLKAGGFGLNLTVADYVYLVDPWWNPAVEAQAIDRVHRIGQDKKVFAYRMICKDTIEEKIIQLQEKKKSLAKEIVASEQSFVKNLTKDDIEDLFS